MAKKPSEDGEAAMETSEPASGENGAKVEEAAASGASETKTIVVEMNEAKSEEPAAEASEAKPVDGVSEAKSVDKVANIKVQVWQKSKFKS